MTDRTWHLCLVVCFHPETGLIIPVPVLDELGVLLDMAGLRGRMVSAIAYSAICAIVPEEGV